MKTHDEHPVHESSFKTNNSIRAPTAPVTRRIGTTIGGNNTLGITIRMAAKVSEVVVKEMTPICRLDRTQQDTHLTCNNTTQHLRTLMTARLISLCRSVHIVSQLTRVVDVLKVALPLWQVLVPRS